MAFDCQEIKGLLTYLLTYLLFYTSITIVVNSSLVTVVYNILFSHSPKTSC